MYSFLPALSLLFTLLYWKSSAKRNLSRSMLPTVTAFISRPFSMFVSTPSLGLAASKADELRDVTTCNAAAIVLRVVFYVVLLSVVFDVLCIIFFPFLICYHLGRVACSFTE